MVDQKPIKGLRQENDLLSLGYSFGRTGFNNVVHNAIGTIRVETKSCQLAYLEPSSLYAIMHKHKIKKDEKMLAIVRSLPYFKGITRNTAMRVASFFEKKKPCLNQVLIK